MSTVIPIFSKYSLCIIYKWFTFSLIQNAKELWVEIGQNAKELLAKIGQNAKELWTKMGQNAKEQEDFEWWI